MWTCERCVATDEPAVATTIGGRQWELLPLPALVQWTWLPTCARATGCKIDPLDWLLADSGRQPKGKESATCSTLPAPSPPPLPCQNTVAGRKECGISKTCFRATQGESLEVGVAVGVSLVVIYARFLILPTSRHSPSASPPVHAANRFALWSTFCQFANATYDLLSLFQAELAHPAPSWDPPV